MNMMIHEREELVKELDVLLKIFTTLTLALQIRDKAESAINKLINELYSYKDYE